MIFTDEVTYEAMKLGRNVLTFSPCKESVAAIYKKLSTLDEKDETDQ